VLSVTGRDANRLHDLFVIDALSECALTALATAPDWSVEAHRLLLAVAIWRPISTGDAARAAGCSRGFASRVLNEQHQLGNVEPEPGADARERRWSLTAAGDRRAKRIHDRFTRERAAIERAAAATATGDRADTSKLRLFTLAVPPRTHEISPRRRADV
jgi:DNA-binding MarR family transcriptional regulator